MAKTLAVIPDGSKPLKNNLHERYARYRAQALPRVVAYCKAGNATSGNGASVNACRLERRPGIRERVEYLSRQAQERIAEKRQRLEEQLWAIHEADIGDCFETYEAAKSDRDGKLETDAAGKMPTARKQRPKLLSDLPPDLRKAIEHVHVDARGNHPFPDLGGIPRSAMPVSERGPQAENLLLFFCESACSRLIIFLFFPVKAVSPGVYFSDPTGALSVFPLRLRQPRR
jgi:hypothetical protein